MEALKRDNDFSLQLFHVPVPPHGLGGRAQGSVPSEAIVAADAGARQGRYWSRRKTYCTFLFMITDFDTGFGSGFTDSDSFGVFSLGRDS